jgi:hypothetical protein
MDVKASNQETKNEATLLSILKTALDRLILTF